jgi:hypothetical protein
MKIAIAMPPKPKPSSYERAVWASVLAKSDPKFNGRDAEAVAETLWPADRNPAMLIKATQTPGSSATVGWGKEVAGEAFGAFLGSLSPYSAVAQIMAQGTLSPFEGSGSKRHPVRTSAAAPMAWVEQLDVIPVINYAVGNATLTPKKMAVISVISRELTKYSDAMAIFNSIFLSDAGLSFDAAYLSTAAVSAARHPGLLDGVTAISLPSVDANEDLAGLASVVAPNGSGEFAFITGQANAARYGLRHPESRAVVLGSAAVPADRLICIDPRALIHGHASTPDIDISTDGTVHMSDTPLELVADDTTKADPVRSLFQTDGIGIRMFLDIAFAKRRSNAVAYADGVQW